MIHFQLLKQFKDVAEQAGIYFCQLNLNESAKSGTARISAEILCKQK
jgi:hypothetical protein